VAEELERATACDSVGGFERLDAPNGWAGHPIGRNARPGGCYGNPADVGAGGDGTVQAPWGPGDPP